MRALELEEVIGGEVVKTAAAAIGECDHRCRPWAVPRHAHARAAAAIVKVTKIDHGYNNTDNRQQTGYLVLMIESNNQNNFESSGLLGFLGLCLCGRSILIGGGFCV